MNLAVPRDVYPGEVRVALIPEHVAKLVKAGADVAIESGLGQTLRIVDEKYTEAGASVVADHNQLIQNADVVLRIRKPLPEEVAAYKPWQRQRLAVIGGITGLWQVSGRSDLTFDELCLLDIYYIENWSVAFDIRILLQTIPHALFGRGAY